MKRGNKQTAFFITVFVLTALSLFVLQFEMTGNVISEDWCQGADINQDGVVNDIDYTIFSAHYGENCEGPSWCNGADINKDEIVDNTDFNIIAVNYNRTDCSSGTAKVVGFNSPCDQGGGECFPEDPSGVPGNSCTKLNREFLDLSCNEEGYECCGEVIQTQTTSNCIKNNADVNKDKKINDTDKKIIQTWMVEAQECSSPDWCDCADINQDGTVNQLDMDIYNSASKPRTCGDVNYTICGEESVNPKASCEAKGFEWAKDSSLDETCGNADTFGCCCKYGYNEAAQACYTVPQKQSPQNKSTPNESSHEDKSPYYIKSSQFKEGYTKELKEGEQIKFKLKEKDGKIKYHTFEVIKITKNTVEIEVSSKTQKAILEEGDSTKFDLTNNGYYDLLVTVKKIKTNRAEIKVKEIKEKVTSKEQVTKRETINKARKTQREDLGEEEEEDNNNKIWVYILVLTVILIVFIILLLYLVARRRNQQY